MTLFNATPEESREIHAGLVAGLENGTLNPVIGKEFPLAEAARAHGAVMESGAYGKIVLVRIQGARPDDLGGLTEDLLSALRARALHLSVVLVDPPRQPSLRAAGDDLGPRLAALLEREGVDGGEAGERAAALLGEAATEARAS